MEPTRDPAILPQRNPNPFVENPPLGFDTRTPYIPNLVAGAEVFGRLDGIDGTDSFFAQVRAAAPDGAIAALYRVHQGPGIYNINFEAPLPVPGSFQNFDFLLLIELLGDPLVNPMLGIDLAGTDAAFMRPLVSAGFMTDPQFGGLGPPVLGQLAGHEVYATLIPSAAELAVVPVFNFGGDGLSATNLHLMNGQAVYLVQSLPEPSGWLLDAAGLAALTVARVTSLRRSKVGPKGCQN